MQAHRIPGTVGKFIGAQGHGILLQVQARGGNGQHRDVPGEGILPDGPQHLGGTLVRQGHAEQHGGDVLAVAVDEGDGASQIVSGVHGALGEARFHKLPEGRALVHHQNGPFRGGLQGGQRAAGLAPGFLLEQKGFHPLRGHGLAQQVALGIVAAQLPQAAQLLPGFHTLGHHLQVHPAGQAHDKAQNALIHGLGGFVADELHVQLQHIQLHLVEHVQRGVAAAEIVHLDDEAQGAQLIHSGDNLRRAFSVGALGDFQMEQPGLQVIFAQQAQQQLRQVRLADVRAGHVDGDGNDRVALIQPGAQCGGRLVPDELVEPGNEAVFLKQGDELPRGQEAPLGMNPAHQGLRPGQGIVVEAEFGLQVHAELPLGQGILHDVGDGLLPQELAPEGIVINCQVAVVVPLDAVRGQQGPVAHLVDAHAAVDDFIDPEFQHHVSRGVGGAQEVRVDPGEEFVGIVPLPGDQRQESIRCGAALDGLASQPLLAVDCQRLQEPVSGGNAVVVVEELEILHIGAEDHVVLVGIGLQDLLGAAVEKLTVI